MRFSRVVLENWRNFGHVDVPLQSRAFLVGPNASGKSNFLDAIRFLRDLVITGGGFEQAVLSRGGVSRIRNLAARRYSDVMIEVELQDQNDDQNTIWRYRIKFNQDKQRNPYLKEEAVWLNDDLLLQRPDSDDQNDPARLKQTHLEQTFANVRFRPIAEFFSSVTYYHLVPQLVRDPDRWIGEKNDPFGADFLEQIAAANQNVRVSRLKRITDALKVAVPYLTELKLDRDIRGAPHLIGNYGHWRPHGAWQNEADFSDGTLRLMGLLWTLLDSSGPLLFEEPELSLHPAVVRFIPQMMLRAQRKHKSAEHQVILSTHSSELLSDQGIGADETLLLMPEQEGSRVRVAADIVEVRLLLETGLPLGEVVIPFTQPGNTEQLALF